MTLIQANKLDLRGPLNDVQYEAATHLEGPLLIVAGAGSGKTRTLVHRVAWLIDQGIEPASILLLTFTRKAAEEMLGRCEALVGGMVGRVSGGTFHSLANSILRVYAPKLGFSNRFTIMDRDDSESLIGRLRSEEAATKGDSKFPKRGTIQNIFSQAVNKDIGVSELLAKSYSHLKEHRKALVRLFEAYQKHKFQADLMDFDDLLYYLERLFIENADLRQEISARYSYILVDEYQDTNAIQARLTAHLGLGHLNVTAVGDEAQSIYSFRGANFRNIMDFPRIFPGTKILKLEENYRSHPQILYVANHLLKQAKETFDKVLRPIREDGPLPKVSTFDNFADEAAAVCDLIEADLVAGHKLSDMAVLFRAASHSFDLEAQLNWRRIPYTKYGGRKFVEMAHVKDFLSYLKLAVNPRDEVSLRRVLGNVEGLGAKGQEKVAEWAQGLIDYAPLLGQAPLSREKARQNLAELGKVLAELMAPGLPTDSVTQIAFDHYKDLLPTIFPDDHPDRLNDILEIKAMADESEDLVTFLTTVTLDPPSDLTVGPDLPPVGATDGRADTSQAESGGPKSDLTLSTIHSAKGLEWSRVYLVSAVEGRFPSAYAKDDDIEEELRLMYVAVTRARDRLSISMPMGGRSHGAAVTGPSRFLAGLDPDQVEFVEENQAVFVNQPFERLDKTIGRVHSLPKKTIAEPRTRHPLGTAGGKEISCQNRFIKGQSLASWDQGDVDVDADQCQEFWDQSDTDADQSQEYWDQGDVDADQSQEYPEQSESDSVQRQTGLGQAGLGQVGRDKAGRGQASRYQSDLSQSDGQAIGSQGLARAPGVGEKSGQFLDGLYPGQRVKHPGFGQGSVLGISGGTATIDFDQFGKKTVMIRYSKLTAP
ncbi:MAG: UvrD-helicase domain-containing protein [Deltaproteobacteria bacterium]|jgi:DNA helicase-2/ATP-dependent DNA helicase PcrA|nr:UvrD-helicase domain-containing protein [Deltaproteobacteria bacterium]